MPDKTSVIVPTRGRRPELLAHALESALGQRGVRIEVVVVNDGGPGEVLPSEYRRDPRIRYLVRGASGGPARARNLGVRTATGTHVAYLDDDDAWAPDHLRGLKGRCAPVAYSVTERVIVDGGLVVRRDHPFAHPFSRDALLVGGYIPVTSVLHERRCADEAGGFDPRCELLEDWEMLIRWSRRWDFAFVPEATCFYTQVAGGGQRVHEVDRSTEWLRRIYAGTRRWAAAAPGVLERRRLALERRRARRERGLKPWDPIDLAWMFGPRDRAGR